MKQVFVLLPLLLAACSQGASQEQQRIDALEQENAQLRDELKKQKDNVAKLRSALSRGESSIDESDEAPGQPTVPEPVSPAPPINSGSDGGPAAQPLT